MLRTGYVVFTVVTEIDQSPGGVGPGGWVTRIGIVVVPGACVGRGVETAGAFVAGATAWLGVARGGLDGSDEGSGVCDSGCVAKFDAEAPCEAGTSFGDGAATAAAVGAPVPPGALVGPPGAAHALTIAAIRATAQTCDARVRFTARR